MAPAGLQIYGGAGDDILIGATAAPGRYWNQLWGGAGNDTASYAGMTRLRKDALWGMGSADRLVYTSYDDSPLAAGYDEIADLITGVCTLDLAALNTDPSHVVIASDPQDPSDSPFEEWTQAIRQKLVFPGGDRPCAA